MKRIHIITAVILCAAFLFSVRVYGTELNSEITGEAAETEFPDVVSPDFVTEYPEDFEAPAVDETEDASDVDLLYWDMLEQEEATGPAEEEVPLDLLETSGIQKYNVKKFGADGTDKKDDWSAIQTALNKARNASGTIMITIPAGTYYISKNLAVFSDTIVKLSDKTKIVATYYGNPMIYGAHQADDGSVCDYGPSCDHGGYSQVSRVKIIGGIWDHNDQDGLGNDSAISFRHSNHIRIQDLTVQNCVSHFINLSGVNTAVVKNVTIKNSIPYNGTDPSWWGSYDVGDRRRFRTIEAVHLDYCNANAESTGRALPCDNTPSKNIIVAGCHFYNVFSGVGTHHYAIDGRGATNIVIRNNVVKNMQSAFVYGTDFEDLTIADNRLENCASISQLWRCHANIRDNVYRGASDPFSYMNAIYACEYSRVAVDNNRIGDAVNTAVLANDHSRVSLHGNIIARSANGGVYAADSRLAAAGNKIYDSAEHGVYCENASYTLKNNLIRNSYGHSFFSEGGSSGTLIANKLRTSGLTNVYVRDTTVKFTDNRLSGSGKFAFYASESSLNFRDNILNGSGDGYTALRTDRSHVVIADNKLTGSLSWDALKITDCPEAAVVRNRISSFGSAGIHMINSGRSRVTGNLFSGFYPFSYLFENCVGNILRVGKPVLKSAKTTEKGVRVVWTRTNGADKYRVYRKVKGGKWKRLKDVRSNSCLDKTAKKGGTYYYTVRCLDESGHVISGCSKKGIHN